MQPLSRCPLARRQYWRQIITLQGLFAELDRVRRPLPVIGDAGGGDGAIGGSSSRRAPRRAGDGAGTGAAKNEGLEAVAVAERVELNGKHGVGDLAVDPDKGLPMT